MKKSDFDGLKPVAGPLADYRPAVYRYQMPDGSAALYCPQAGQYERLPELGEDRKLRDPKNWPRVDPE